jgi:integrase
MRAARAPQLRDGGVGRWVPAKVVSERLGHANIAITMDTSSHVLPGLDEQAAGPVIGRQAQLRIQEAMVDPGQPAAQDAAGSTAS